MVNMQGVVTSWLVLCLGLSGLGSSPGWGHCVLFSEKRLYSHSVSTLSCMYKWVSANWGLACDGHLGGVDVLLDT